MHILASCQIELRWFWSLSSLPPGYAQMPSVPLWAGLACSIYNHLPTTEGKSLFHFSVNTRSHWPSSCTARALRMQRLRYSPKNTCHLSSSTAKQQSPHENNETAFKLGNQLSL